MENVKAIRHRLDALVFKIQSTVDANGWPMGYSEIIHGIRDTALFCDLLEAKEPPRQPGLSNEQCFGAIAAAIGLFASAIKSGEPWTYECENALNDAQIALVSLGDRVKQ